MVMWCRFSQYIVRVCILYVTMDTSHIGVLVGHAATGLNKTTKYVLSYLVSFNLYKDLKASLKQILATGDL